MLFEIFSKKGTWDNFGTLNPPGAVGTTQLVMTAVEGSFSTEQDLLLDSCKGGKEIFLHMDLFFSGG